MEPRPESEHQQAQEARRLEKEKNVVYIQCGRCFRRESDKACHKYIAERRKSVNDAVRPWHIMLSIIAVPQDLSVFEHNSKILGHNDSNKCEYKVMVQKYS